MVRYWRRSTICSGIAGREWIKSAMSAPTWSGANGTLMMSLGKVAPAARP